MTIFISAIIWGIVWAAVTNMNAADEKRMSIAVRVQENVLTILRLELEPTVLHTTLTVRGGSSNRAPRGTECRRARQETRGIPARGRTRYQDRKVKRGSAGLGSLHQSFSALSTATTSSPSRSAE